jgi:predicted ester cyclase
MELQAHDGLIAPQLVAGVHHLHSRLVPGPADVAQKDPPGLTDENGRELVGPKAFREFHRRYLDAFPGVRVEVADIIVQGDKMAARCIVRGRHLGNGLGIEATQKETEFTGMCIARVQGGKIVEAWNNFDFLTMHSQLGTLDKLGR